MNKILSIVTLFVLMMVPASATTILVPQDYSTIQGGIDASSDGDTVFVLAGTYVENINLNGKNIVVQGEEILRDPDNNSIIINETMNGRVQQ